MEKDTNIKKNLSVFVLFYAFGITTDKKIIEMCSMKDKNIQDFVKLCLSNFKFYYWQELIKIYGQKYNEEKEKEKDQNDDIHID